MPFGNVILIALLGLLVAEAGVFLLVARAVGGLTALMALLATSILGGFLLGRIGRKLAAAVATAMARNDPTMMQVRPGGFMTVLGAMLLVLPGFITDLIGLLLLVPAIQTRIVAMLPVRWTRRSDDVVDLDPNEWRDIPEARIGKRRGEKPEP